MASRFQNFSERARRVLSLAQEEAMSRKHSSIEPEHLLLGLMLYILGLRIGLSELRDKRYDIIFSLTPDTVQVIQFAADEAQRMGHPLIEPEHLLIGLMCEGKSIAAGVLKGLGVSLEQVRATTIIVMKLLHPSLIFWGKSSNRGGVPVRPPLFSFSNMLDARRLTTDFDDTVAITQ